MKASNSVFVVVGEEVEERLDAAFLDDALVQLRVRRQVRQPERHLLLLARK